MAAVKKRSGGGRTLQLLQLFAVFLFSFFCLSESVKLSGNSASRKVTVALNPGAPSLPVGGDLLHVRAEGDNDTLHFLFCSQGAPTLLLVHTNSSSSAVTVNWTQFEARNLSGSLKVEPESSVLYSTAVVFSRLLEYDDLNDTAVPTSDLFPYELQSFSWSRLNLSGPSALLCGAAAAFANGSLCVQLSVFGSEGRGQSWPRLLHTADSAQLAVWLDGVLPRATHSRFLLELQTVGGANPPDHVEVLRSIDDEFTPSIFKVSQWVSALNVSFGLAGEPFYNSTKFFSWTLLVGTGEPPVDSFSPLVLAMMAVGLGTPTVLLLLGGVCVCVRKRAAASAIYEPIN